MQRPVPWGEHVTKGRDGDWHVHLENSFPTVLLESVMCCGASCKYRRSPRVVVVCFGCDQPSRVTNPHWAHCVTVLDVGNLPSELVEGQAERHRPPPLWSDSQPGLSR